MCEADLLRWLQIRVLGTALPNLVSDVDGLDKISGYYQVNSGKVPFLVLITNLQFRVVRGVFKCSIPYNQEE